MKDVPKLRGEPPTELSKESDAAKASTRAEINGGVCIQSICIIVLSANSPRSIRLVNGSGECS